MNAVKGLLTVLTLLTLAGCSGGFGSSNPFGSFGSFGSLGSLNPFGSSEEVDPATGRPNVEDETVLVEAIESVRPEPALRGVILRATVITATEGYHTVQFVGRNEGLPDENGIVTYDIRAIPPEIPGRVGPLQARRVIVATFVPDSELDEIRGFRIVSRTQTIDLRR